ncbi:MAG: SDR family NAD(P)-dependent oxidoreductase [Opitutales bacterium]
MESTAAPQRIFIGGISGSIGSALAQRLHEQGREVVGFSRRGGGELPAGVRAFQADARDSVAVERVFGQAEKVLGGIDAYVHAIGSVFLKPIHLMKDEEWDEVMATNLTSAFYASRSAVNRMRKARAGRILFFSSAASRIGIGNHEVIASAKAGINGLTQALAASCAPAGIRVNALALGLVETHATAGIVSTEQAKKISQSMHPTGDIGHPEQVASFAQWLLSAEADWLTGQVLPFDGGLSAVLPKPRA